MAIDQRKRQQKLERRAAKRKDRQIDVARRGDQSLADRLAGAARCPILSCWATEDIWEKGIGYVCLSRQTPSGVAFALLLLDRQCLGVKNVIVGIRDRFAYDRDIERDTRKRFDAKDMAPAAARKLVEGAVAYARGLGLPPHPEYATAECIFGDIDASQCADTFEYGKDGQPYFISGPYDSPPKCRRVMAALRQSVGDGNFHYLIGGPAAKSLISQDRLAEFDEDEE
jgi:hypothetical protein